VKLLDRIGCDIVKVYKDHGVSGAKGRDRRPQFDALCHDATKRQFDLVMAWSVDRLGRSLQDHVQFLSEIRALRVDLYLHQQGIDTLGGGGPTLHNPFVSQDQSLLIGKSLPPPGGCLRSHATAKRPRRLH
jgi:DNA invertase Pin-like site-specific DNA recombinase